MCGIAGYSLSSRSSVDRTLAAQALLAGIADRGADAVGYAYRGGPEEYPVVMKQRTPAVARPRPGRSLLCVEPNRARGGVRVRRGAATTQRGARRDVPCAPVGPRRPDGPLPPRPQLRRGDEAADRARAGRERALPQATCRDRAHRRVARVTSASRRARR